MNPLTNSRSRGILVRCGILIAVLILTQGCATYTEVAYAPPPEPYYEEDVEYDAVPDPAYAMFDELSAHGEWIESASFGWVWRPYVVSAWQPYFHGEWILTDYGWTWVSYEPFGWAVYHYGYWHYDPSWGWLWVPDYEWQAARVTWVVYDDYICWAPLAPRNHYYGDPWDVHVDTIWMVVDVRHFANPNVGRYRLKRPGAARSLKRTISRRAPDVRYVSKRSKTPIRPVKIKVQTVRKGKVTHKKIVLPPQHRKKVDRYAPRIEKKVMSRKSHAVKGTKPGTRTGTSKHSVDKRKKSGVRKKSDARKKSDVKKRSSKKSSDVKKRSTRKKSGGKKRSGGNKKSPSGLR